MDWVKAIAFAILSIVGFPLTVLIVGNIAIRPIDWLSSGWVRRNFIVDGSGRLEEFMLFGVLGALVVLGTGLLFGLVMMSHELLDKKP